MLEMRRIPRKSCWACFAESCDHAAARLGVALTDEQRTNASQPRMGLIVTLVTLTNEIEGYDHIREYHNMSDLVPQEVSYQTVLVRALQRPTWRTRGRPIVPANDAEENQSPRRRIIPADRSGWCRTRWPTGSVYRIRNESDGCRDQTMPDINQHAVAAIIRHDRSVSAADPIGALPRTPPGALPLDPAKGFALGTHS